MSLNLNLKLNVVCEAYYCACRYSCLKIKRTFYVLSLLLTAFVAEWLPCWDATHGSQFNSWAGRFVWSIFISLATLSVNCGCLFMCPHVCGTRDTVFLVQGYIRLCGIYSLISVQLFRDLINNYLLQ